MNLRTQVAQLIKDLRKEAGLTQTELARQCFMESQARMSRLENGHNEPTFAEIEKLCEILNVDVHITITQKREPVVRSINV